MVIGVIGGAGVAATNKLCQLLEEKYTINGAYRDCHHPEMAIYQATSAPSRSLYLEGRGESFIDDYVNVANKLSNIGASFLCMSCNTAHYAIDDIARRINIPIINMIEAVAYEIKKSKKSRVGLMASDGCLIGKVYEKYLLKLCPEIEIIYPDLEFQKEVSRGICNVKNKSRFLDILHDDRPFNIFSKVYDHLTFKGSECVIAGCTDIRVDFKHDNVYDSLEILANKIYEISRYGK